MKAFEHRLKDRFSGTEDIALSRFQSPKLQTSVSQFSISRALGNSQKPTLPGHLCGAMVGCGLSCDSFE